MTKNKGRVTGIGGIFIQSENPDKLKNWYCEHLGMIPNEYGSMFENQTTGKEVERKFMQWSTMPKNSEYFKPSKATFMINYRVDNIEAMVDYFKEVGIKVVDEIENYEFGKFVHILDPDGNKIELWEPIDSSFSKEYSRDQTTHD